MLERKWSLEDLLLNLYGLGHGTGGNRPGYAWLLLACLPKGSAQRGEVGTLWFGIFLLGM